MLSFFLRLNASNQESEFIKKNQVFVVCLFPSVFKDKLTPHQKMVICIFFTLLELQLPSFIIF